MTEVDIPANPEPITLDITRTALIVVGMQNAFAKKGGMLDVLGDFNEARANLVIANKLNRPSVMPTFTSTSRCWSATPAAIPAPILSRTPLSGTLPRFSDG